MLFSTTELLMTLRPQNSKKLKLTGYDKVKGLNNYNNNMILFQPNICWNFIGQWVKHVQLHLRLWLMIYESPKMTKLKNNNNLIGETNTLDPDSTWRKPITTGDRTDDLLSVRQDLQPLLHYVYILHDEFLSLMFFVIFSLSLCVCLFWQLRVLLLWSGPFYC